MIPALAPIVQSGLLSQSTSVLVFNSIQALGIAAQFKAESEAPTAYSKFALGKPETEKKRVSSRTGMFIIYAPANIVSLLFLISSLYTPVAPVASLCFIHFLKRNLEVMFLHKYSGTVELEISQFIGFFYAFISFMICMVSRTEVDPQTMQLAQGELSKRLEASYWQQIRRSNTKHVTLPQPCSALEPLVTCTITTFWHHSAKMILLVLEKRDTMLLKADCLNLWLLRIISLN